MPTLGAVASSFRFSGQFLDIAEDIDTIRTTNRIYLRNDAGDNEWSFGMDSSRNWTLRNEQLNEDTISSDINSRKVTIFDLSGGGGVTDLSDLNDVNTSNVQKGSVMYYDNLTSTYFFTDTLRFLKANSEWDIQGIPLRFSAGDLQILQDPADLTKNIHIGGIPRTGQTADGNSICLGVGAGATNQKGNCLAIGFNAGGQDQGTGFFTTGSSIAIGNSAGTINQSHNSLAIGFGAGYSNQFASCIAIGENAGNLSQQTNSLACGLNAGRYNQKQSSIAIGHNSGLSNCGEYSVHIGAYAGNVDASAYSIGIGWEANTFQGGANSIAIGKEAGRNILGENSIAIGTSSGRTNGGQNCIYLGEAAGLDGGNFDNVIVLNGTAGDINPAGANRCYIKPLRNDAGSSFVKYDVTSGEVTYNTDIFQEQLEQPQVNTPSGTGNLQLINGAISGTLNRLSYTPPAIPAIPAPPPSRYATAYVNQALSSGLFQLSFSNAFTPVGITTSNLNVFTIQATGIYQLTYNINAIGSSTWNWHYLNIFKNSTNFQKSYFYSPTSVSQHTCHGGGFIVSLVAGDMWQFEVWSNGTSTVTGYASINQIA